MAQTLLFVYGSLQRGCRNHHLLAGQEFLQIARTVPRYRLYDRGSYPCLVEEPEHGVAVQGEVWRVDDRVFAALDELEEVPTVYVRREIALEAVPPPVWAYFYQGDVSGFPDCGERWPSINADTGARTAAPGPSPPGLE